MSEHVSTGFTPAAFSGTWGEIGTAAGLILLAAYLAFPTVFSRRPRVSPVEGARRILGSLLGAAPAIALLVWIIARSVPHMQDAPSAFVSATGPESTIPVSATHESETHGVEVLHIRQMSSAPPAWADGAPELQGDATTVVVSSQRFATLEEAERQMTERVLELVRSHFHSEFPQRGGWHIPLSAVETHAVQQVLGESIDKDFGNGIQGRMYRAHARLNLSPELRGALHETWRHQVVHRRLTVLGSVLALITLMLATSSAYVRLDDQSGGRYRWRLRLASLAVLAAGGLAASSVIGRFEFPLG